jgi:hypothetical protein
MQEPPNRHVSVAKKSGSGRWEQAAGLDFHVFRTLLLRGWSILAGGGTALLVPTFLSPSQQGYYYTFASVLATQIFFELGLNHVLTQMTSHAAAHLQRSIDGRQLTGELQWRRAVLSLVKLSTKWNAWMASLFAMALLIGGGGFFHLKGTLPTSEWIGPWTVLVCASAVNLAMSARLAICEGLGEVGQVAHLRLKLSMVSYCLLWLVLLTGNGLWAATALPLVSAIGTFRWLRQHPILSDLRLTKSDGGVEGYSWRRDVFPLQWKIAVSWASGYFIFNFLTPVVFAYQGPVAAGQLGLALTVFGAVATVGISWISAKIPAFSSHIARGERTELNALFDHQARRCIAVTSALAATFVIAAWLLGGLFPTMLQRLPPMLSLCLLAVATSVNSAVFAMAAYMRAHKAEPLMPLTLVISILIGIGVFAMSHVSLNATVAAYAAPNLLVSLPWCTRIYLRYRQRVQ